MFWMWKVIKEWLDIVILILFNAESWSETYEKNHEEMLQNLPLLQIICFKWHLWKSIILQLKMA